MTTGVPSVDNLSKELKENLIESLMRSEKLKNDLLVKLEKATRSEREFILFKLIFNGLNQTDKNSIEEIIKSLPIFSRNVIQVIKISIDARKYSQSAIYNRDKCCVEIMKLYKSLLEKMTILSKELTLANSLDLSILYSYLLWNGYLSKEKKHNYKENTKDEPIGLLFTDIINGQGVCRNYSEMLKDFLNINGYNSVILENHMDNNTMSSYRMDINRGRINQISDINERTLFKKKKANHTFNLIEDNGIYIYDATNLLLYNFKDKNTATLINGKGKNIIYPYHSYDFCYSKSDEQLLDKIITEDSFESAYDKTDFISTSEVDLELLKNSKSLLEDFYTEAKSDIDGISEERKKILTKTK